MTATGVYVYAITRTGDPLPANAVGVGGPPAPLRLIGPGQVTAVVSDAPARLRAKRRDLLAHQDLLMLLADRGPVLPMRFGMVAPDEETVLGQLAGSEPAYLATLRHLSHRVEINLKALPAQDALAAVVAQDGTVRRLRDEARRRPGYETSVRLGEAVAKALSRRAAEAGKTIVHKLRPMARAVAPGPEVHGCSLNVSFLVDRSDIDDFRATALRFADTHRERVELRLAGPLPCYSFVTLRDLPAPAVGV